MGNSDNVIGYIEYLSDDGKIIGYVTPFTDVDKFRKEILKAAEVGMPKAIGIAAGHLLAGRLS